MSTNFPCCAVCLVWLALGARKIPYDVHPLPHVTCHVLCMHHNYSYFFVVQSGGSSWWRVCYQRGLPRLVSRRYTIIPGIAAAGAAAVLRDPEVLLAGQPDQQPGIHGPQNYQQQSRLVSLKFYL